MNIYLAVPLTDEQGSCDTHYALIELNDKNLEVINKGISQTKGTNFSLCLEDLPVMSIWDDNLEKYKYKYRGLNYTEEFTVIEFRTTPKELVIGENLALKVDKKHLTVIYDDGDDANLSLTDLKRLLDDKILN
jgi:hypothetical protein